MAREFKRSDRVAQEIQRNSSHFTTRSERSPYWDGDGF